MYESNKKLSLSRRACYNIFVKTGTAGVPKRDRETGQDGKQTGRRDGSASGPEIYRQTDGSVL